MPIHDVEVVRYSLRGEASVTTTVPEDAMMPSELREARVRHVWGFQLNAALAGAPILFLILFLITYEQLERKSSRHKWQVTKRYTHHTEPRGIHYVHSIERISLDRVPMSSAITLSAKMAFIESVIVEPSLERAQELRAERVREKQNKGG